MSPFPSPNGPSLLRSHGRWSHRCRSGDPVRHPLPTELPVCGVASVHRAAVGILGDTWSTSYELYSIGSSSQRSRSAARRTGALSKADLADTSTSAALRMSGPVATSAAIWVSDGDSFRW